MARKNKQYDRPKFVYPSAIIDERVLDVSTSGYQVEIRRKPKTSFFNNATPPNTNRPTVHSHSNAGVHLLLTLQV